MKAELITESPSWFILLCLLAGIAYAYVLYRKEPKFDETGKFLIGLMSFFRFLAISIICFFLLGPFIKTGTRTVERPIVVIAQDNSESIVSGKDSAYYRTAYLDKLNALKRDLEDDYEIKTYTFGEEVKEGLEVDYQEKESDFSQFFDEIETRFSNRNLGAVVIASDGLYNQGHGPLYASSKLKIPIYSLALGDTTRKKDLLISKVNHNRLAFLGNTFPVEILVSASRLKGEKTVLTISRNGITEYEQVIEIDKNRFDVPVLAQLEAKETGIQRYDVKLKGVEGESILSNNRAQLFIDIMDSRQKILILAEAPHPDIKALKSSVESRDRYELDVKMANDFNGVTSGYNMVILHRLPSAKHPIKPVLERLKRENTSTFFIMGSSTAVSAFNGEGTGLVISGNRNNYNDTKPIPSSKFSLFTMGEKFVERTRKYPPLLSHFGQYKSAVASEVLLHQKIGMVDTEHPLFQFYQSDERKIAVLAGEGIWRWKMAEYAQYESNEVFDELFLKTIQFLALKTDKSQFRVQGNKNFMENQTIQFNAELYNDSYELITDPDVSFTIINEDGEQFPFTFSKVSKGYRLDAGVFPVGNYTYVARTESGGEVLKKEGAFSVSPVLIESSKTVADHQLMYNLAARNDGKLVYGSNVEELTSLISSREDIVPISFLEKKLRELVDLKWIFFLILGLITFEWFIRKWQGAY